MSAEKALEALKKRDFPAARALMSGQNPTTFGIHHFLIQGLAELAMEDWAAAHATFTAATARFPQHALFWLNRGIAEENVGLIDAAIQSHENCLTLIPRQGEACGNLANLYRKKKRYAESETMARRALEYGAAKADAYNALGLACARQGKLDEAHVALTLAREAGPDNPNIILNQANLAIDRLRFDEAWPLFAASRAIDDKPIIRRDEGMARMFTGDYGRGWPLYESRLQTPNALRLHPDIPLWRGEPLKGKKLLIIAEQGFGDVIQFSRYFRFVAETQFVWALPRNLLRLFSNALPGMVLCETDPLPPCDFYIPIMSLPLATRRIAPESQGPHFQPPPSPALPPATHAKKIGLVWSGSPTHERDKERSLPFNHLAPLLTLPVTFYAPFTGAALDDIGAAPVIRLDSLISDFADTASLLSQLDALITVDTAIAHLAGTLGLKTYLLLAHCPDWRWGHQGDTTPWYKNMTLVRQPRTGDWPSVVTKLKGLLESSL